MDPFIEELSLSDYMQQAQAGDKHAYAALLKDITPLLRSFVGSRISDSSHIEDLVQDILISVHKARHTYDSKRPFKPWLLAIATYRLNDYLRQCYRSNAYKENIYEQSKVVDPYYIHQTDLRSEWLEEAIALLPVKQKVMLKLLHVEGYSIKEVASKMGMSSTAVKVASHRTYKKLKNYIEEKEREDADI